MRQRTVIVLIALFLVVAAVPAGLGSFTTAGADELLVVVSWVGQAHAEGFYNVAAAVFDRSGRRLAGEVLYFTADEGQTALFTGKGRTYLGYVGSTTFQGSSEWHGGLYAAGAKWEQLWPVDPTTFWRNRAADVTADGFTVYDRVPVPPTVPGQTIPDYQSVPDDVGHGHGKSCSVQVTSPQQPL